MRCFVLILMAVALAAAKISYEGHSVWRIEAAAPSTGPLLQLAEQQGMDVWAQGHGWLDVMVAPRLGSSFREKLRQLNLTSEIYIEDVQRLVDDNFREQHAHPRRPFNFEQYNLLEDIEQYLFGLAATDSRTSLSSLGRTVEGRDMWQLKISVGPGRQAVWLDCGIHAREWISPATCLWGINFLLSGYGHDPSVTQVLDTYDLHVLPVYNPDGYSYTQQDRMWRKNRKHYPGEPCVGVDLNRNYDNHFGGLGTSDFSCSEVYRGPSPASELETQHVQAGIRALQPKCLFTLHSYSQLWMYPYSWTFQLPPEAPQLDAIAAAAVQALRAVHGTIFAYGPVATTISPAAGVTEDYAYYHGVVHSYSIELRDTGRYGFLLPENQITPTAEETWAGLLTAMLAVP